MADKCTLIVVHIKTDYQQLKFIILQLQLFTAMLMCDTSEPLEVIALQLFAALHLLHYAYACFKQRALYDMHLRIQEALVHNSVNDKTKCLQLYMATLVSSIHSAYPNVLYSIASPNLHFYGNQWL